VLLVTFLSLKTVIDYEGGFVDVQVSGSYVAARPIEVIIEFGLSSRPTQLHEA